MYLLCSLILAIISVPNEISASKKDMFPTWFKKLTEEEKLLISPWIQTYDMELKCPVPLKKESKQEKGCYYLHFPFQKCKYALKCKRNCRK